MFTDPEGPIERFEWGVFTVGGETHGDTKAGRLGVGKDIRLMDGAVTAWRERKGHELTSEMITGMNGREISILVIGTGVYGLLTCPESVQVFIKGQGIEHLILAPTPEACATYNTLFRQGERVALLAHGTC